MMKDKEGYVVVCVNSVNQSKVYVKLKDIKMDPDKANSKTLEDELNEKNKKITTLEKIEKEHEKKIEMALEAISVLLEQAKLNLTQQQLLVLKNKIGGIENV